MTTSVILGVYSCSLTRRPGCCLTRVSTARDLLAPGGRFCVWEHIIQIRSVMFLVVALAKPLTMFRSYLQDLFIHVVQRFLVRTGKAGWTSRLLVMSFYLFGNKQFLRC